MWVRRMLGVLAACAGLALPAASQPGADTLGLPDDTVRIRIARDLEVGDCWMYESVVVKDDSPAAEVRKFGPCADAHFPDLARHTVVGLHLRGDCHSAFRVDAWRSDERRAYLIRTTTYSGGCRAAGGGYFWFVLPKLPPGWTLAFTDGGYSDEVPDVPLGPDRLILPPQRGGG